MKKQKELKQFCSKCGGPMKMFPQIQGGHHNVGGYDPDTGMTNIISLWACSRENQEKGPWYGRYISASNGYRDGLHDFVEIMR